MSDNNDDVNPGSSSRRSQTHRSRPPISQGSQIAFTMARREDRLPADFPLHPSTFLNHRFNSLSAIPRYVGSLQQQFTRLEAGIQGFSTLSIGSGHTASTGRASNSTNGSGISPLTRNAFMNIDTSYGAPPPASRWDQKREDVKVTIPSTKPITTLTTVLPPATYKDESDSTIRSLEYVQVQRRILKWLKTNPSDSLDTTQASSWTRKIGISGQTPKVEEAVRLCYYMRSLGFDVYARFHKTYIALYIADRNSNERGSRIDHLYWRQDLATGILTYQANAASQPSTRRNALAPTAGAIGAHFGSMQQMQQVFGISMRDTRSAAPAPSSEPETNSARARSSNNDAALRAAEARLNAELAGNGDTDVIHAALIEIEELRPHVPEE